MNLDGRANALPERSRSRTQSALSNSCVADPIQARPKHFCETVASMKQRFEDTNKGDDDAIRAKKAQVVVSRVRAR